MVCTDCNPNLSFFLLSFGVTARRALLLIFDDLLFVRSHVVLRPHSTPPLSPRFFSSLLFLRERERERTCFVRVRGAAGIPYCCGVCGVRDDDDAKRGRLLRLRRRSCEERIEEEEGEDEEAVCVCCWLEQVSERSPSVETTTTTSTPRTCVIRTRGFTQSASSTDASNNNKSRTI